MGHPNELGRLVHDSHRYPGANDCPLSHNHRRDVGRLNGWDHLDDSRSWGSGGRNDHYMGSWAVVVHDIPEGACVTWGAFRGATVGGAGSTGV